MPGWVLVVGFFGILQILQMYADLEEIPSSLNAANLCEMHSG